MSFRLSLILDVCLVKNYNNKTIIFDIFNYNNATELLMTLCGFIEITSIAERIDNML